MRRRGEDFPHTHPCQNCGEPVDCEGDLEENYDGYPEVVCRAYHVYGGCHILCPECDAKLPEPQDEDEDDDDGA